MINALATRRAVVKKNELRIEILNYLKARGVVAWPVDCGPVCVNGFLPASGGRIFGVEIRVRACSSLTLDLSDWAAVFGEVGAVHIVASSIHDVRLALDRETTRQRAQTSTLLRPSEAAAP